MRLWLILTPLWLWLGLMGLTACEANPSPPTNRIEEITVTDSGFLVTLPRLAHVGAAGDTGSMLPVLTGGTKIIWMSIPVEELAPGDIVIIQRPKGLGLMVHRIWVIGTDESGWYARTKGDNNNKLDTPLMRAENIEGVVIGIIY
jgi:signal peptidase I